MPHERNEWTPRSRSRQPYRKPFRMRNIVQVKARPGRYWLFGRRGGLLYHGSSKNVRRRLEDEKRLRGDVRTVPRKAEMIEKAEKFDVEYNDNIWDNREAERKEKRQRKPPHNLK